jgi:hypothetical protein
MYTGRTTPLETGHRIQLPADWVEALGLHGRVTLEKTAEGILVRACPPTTWDEIFATKLSIRSGPPDEEEPELELTGDDLLF